MLCVRKHGTLNHDHSVTYPSTLCCAMEHSPQLGFGECQKLDTRNLFALDKSELMNYSIILVQGLLLLGLHNTFTMLCYVETRKGVHHNMGVANCDLQFHYFTQRCHVNATFCSPLGFLCFCFGVLFSFITMGKKKKKKTISNPIDCIPKHSQHSRSSPPKRRTDFSVLTSTPSLFNSGIPLHKMVYVEFVLVINSIHFCM